MKIWQLKPQIFVIFFNIFRVCKMFPLNSQGRKTYQVYCHKWSFCPTCISLVQEKQMKFYPLLKFKNTLGIFIQEAIAFRLYFNLKFLLSRLCKRQK